MMNPVDVPGKCRRFVSILAADGGKTSAFMVGRAPADVRALQTCPVIQGFPGSIQEAGDHPGVKPPLLALGTVRKESRERKKRAAGEVIICVEVLPRALRGVGGGIRWLEKGSALSDRMCRLRKTNC